MIRRVHITSILLTLLAAVVFSSASASAISPLLLPLQGKVQAVGGGAVSDGTFPLTFRLYRVASGGSPIWSEAQSGVAVKNGVFSVLLGSGTSLAGIDFSSGDFYLGLEFNGDGEMSPRMRLASSAFSLESRELQGKEPDDFHLATGDQTHTGSLNVTQFLQGGKTLDVLFLRPSGGTFTGPVTVAGVSGLTDNDIPNTVTASRYLALQGGTLTGEVTFASGQSFPGTVSTAGGTVTGPLAIQGSSGTLTVASTVTLQGATTVQAAATLSAGTTISGALTVSSSAAFSSEVSTAGLVTTNAGLTLAAGSLTLPAASVPNSALQSSVSLLGQTVESAEITDLTIVNGDVNATAAIVYGKLNLAGSLTNADLVAGAFSNITGVGALSAGSIGTGFGAIDVGADAITTTGTITGGTVNATTAVQTNGTTRIGNTGNLLAIGNLTAAGAITIASSVGGNDVIINGADILDVQDAATFASTLTVTSLLTAQNGFTLSGGTLALPATSVADAALSANVALLNRSGQTFTNTNIIQTTTAPQLSVRSDASNRLDMSIGATGGVTLDAVGAGAAFTISDGVSFSSTVNSNLAFANSLILGTAGGNSLTIGRTNASGTTTVNLNDANAIYNYKTNTRTIVIPANECESSSGTPGNVTQGDFPSWRLDNSQADAIRCSFTLPDDWQTSGDLIMQIIYTGSVSSSAAVAFAPQAVPASVGDLTTAAGESLSDLCFTGAYTAGNRLTCSIFIFTGTLYAAGDVASLELARNGSDLEDSYTGNVFILFLNLQYTALSPVSG